MKKIIFLITLFFAINVSAQTKTQSIKIYNDFETFEKEVLNVAQSQTTLINFWATWCKPCMEEMPLFLEMYRDKKYSDINFVFVNMDFKKDIATKVNAYVRKEKIMENTVVLNAPKPNQWINKVSEKWSGALPFTLITHNGKRATHNGKFHALEEIQELLLKVNFRNK